MTKLYRALVGFHYPADPESLKKNKAARNQKDAEKQAELSAQVKWISVKAGDKVMPYNEEILKSWLENEVVEEVKG